MKHFNLHKVHKIKPLLPHLLLALITYRNIEMQRYI